jgi:hypothetical protein
MEDIIERLRNYVATDSDRYAKDGAMLIAADEIKRLQNEILDWQRTVRAQEEQNHELQSKVTSLSLELLTLHGESLGLYNLDNSEDLKEKNKLLNEEIDMWKGMVEGLDNRNLKLTLLLNKAYKLVVGHSPDSNVLEQWEESVDSYDVDDIVDKILYWAEWSDINCDISTDFSSSLSDDLRKAVSEIENLRQENLDILSSIQKMITGIYNGFSKATEDEIKNLKTAGNSMYNAICKHKNLLLTDNFSLSVESWERANHILNTIDEEQ